MTFPLSTADLREHLSTDLGDTALQRLLDAAEAAINARIGAPGARTEIIGGGGRYVATVRPIASVTSITETLWGTTVTLDSTDYRLRAEGYLLERLRTGPHARYQWWGDVTVIYDPKDDDALRTGVEIALLQQILTAQPGVTSERIGDWTQTFASSATWSATDEYQSILSRLDPDPAMVIVGQGDHYGSNW